LIDGDRKAGASCNNDRRWSRSGRWSRRTACGSATGRRRTRAGGRGIGRRAGLIACGKREQDPNNHKPGHIAVSHRKTPFVVGMGQTKAKNRVNPFYRESTRVCKSFAIRGFKKEADREAK